MINRDNATGQKRVKPNINCLFQDVMHTICSPYGQVQRIVIFKKSGMQSMVEYPLGNSVKAELLKIISRHMKIYYVAISECLATTELLDTSLF